MSSVESLDPICSAWITGDAVEDCGPTLVSNPADLDDVAYDASWLLYELTGREWPGLCERTVRPCRQQHTCFTYGVGPWHWTWDGGLWLWRDESGTRCGCGTMEQVKLAGTVLEIVEVKIDGAVIAADTYRLDQRMWLTRMDDPGPPVVKRYWPACQNMSLNDDQPGTFAVTYRWGGLPPPEGRMAAAQLARELWKTCAGEACALPSKVTKVVRQGITVERVSAIATMLRAGSTGMPLVDAFIAGANPNRQQQAPMVWSPDVQPYARKVG